MAEQTTETESTDKQSDSTVTEPSGTSTETQETVTEDGATTTTGTESTEKPEFQDPNMQKAWTEKTQKLAEERKAIEEERKSFEATKRKADILDRLDSNPEIRDYILKKFNGEPEAKEEKSSISQEELDEARDNPEKFAELIKREAQKMVAPITGKVSTLELENTINAYAEDKGNEDFWELYESGLIKSQVALLKSENPRMRNIDLLKQAHVKSREMVNMINDRAEKLASEKAAGIVREKKNAMSDKGGASKVITAESNKGKSLSEIGLKVAQKMGIET